MENNKYFTPNIEDLHIGYELEHLSATGYITTKFEIDSSLPALQELIKLNQIRVPYLTKEQIEAEKWEYLSEGYIGHQSFYKDDFEMSCFYDKHLLKIIKKEKVKTVVLYQGRCKCINEFRKIIKLLEI